MVLRKSGKYLPNNNGTWQQTQTLMITVMIVSYLAKYLKLYTGCSGIEISHLSSLKWKCVINITEKEIIYE